MSLCIDCIKTPPQGFFNYHNTLMPLPNILEPETPFLGLAPFLRLSIAGTDLLPISQTLLEQTQHNPDDANLWMNLSIIMQCLGQRDIGLAMQTQALALKRTYRLPAPLYPPKICLLILVTPGDIATNTPLDCLLEGSDIDLIFFYLDQSSQLSLVPEHDAVMVAIGDSDENRDLLSDLVHALAFWPKPVINTPQNIPLTDRATNSLLLQNITGLFIPPTFRINRVALQAISSGVNHLSELFVNADFPLILRPVGSQAGRDLAKITCPAAISSYLDSVTDSVFFLSPFIDYSSKDGLFRKFRVVLINGQPFICHMAISSHWMVHYVNAGMYEDASKRDEEAKFMTNFDVFVDRHRLVFTKIHERLKLDYFCIDCAETSSGELLVFEMDHVMVVHAMDPTDLFPYKQLPMQRVQQAFREFLIESVTEALL